MHDDASHDDTTGAAMDARLQPKARGHRFWSELAEVLLSIPAGVGIRIGG
ncbi:hypothetical protein [Microbacterium cremeum]|nr:hypothetical protein [Microbacterium cremeum]